MKTDTPKGGELLPCPFCGAAAEWEPWHGGAPTKVMVACSQQNTEACEVGPMVTGETYAAAVAAWNRRAPPSASPAGGEWVTVPRRLTTAMRRATWESQYQAVGGSPSEAEALADKRMFDPEQEAQDRAAYAAMLAAAPKPPEPARDAEGERPALADLIHRFYMAEIGGLMHQAEYWAAHDGPAAVHHRLQKADAYFQIANLFDPRQRALGWKDPFERMANDLARPPINPPGAYPYSPKMHRYNDVHFVSAELKRLTATPPAPSPDRGEVERPDEAFQSDLDALRDDIDAALQAEGAKS